MKKVLYTLLFLLCAFFSFAQPATQLTMQQIIAAPPSPQKLVNDFTSTLTEEQKATLEAKLVRLDDSTFTQIVVVIVQNLGGMDVADAATELGTKWGVGNKKNNSGVVLLISIDDRKLNISPGYGLEGALTDIEANHIIEDVIVPEFKGKNDYYRGIDEGTDAIMSAVRGTYSVPREKKSSGGGGSVIPFLVIIGIIIFLISRGGGRGGGSFMSNRGAIPFLLGSMLGGGGGGGGWGGGGGGSSGGGGGFGGFGGGSFGGGGSSGSW